MTKEKRRCASGRCLLMATSAIGPGFLTQTSKFTSDFQASFGFVILISILLAAVAQMNIWRVLCVTGLRGQEVANKVLPGLGYLVAFMVVLGGLVFNIGNVGGGALGFNTLLGIPTKVGYVLAGGRNPGVPFQKCKRCHGHTDQNSWSDHDRGYFYCDRSCKAAGRFSH